jgi:CHAD domain-containing protein
LSDVRDVAVVIEVIDKLHAECKDQRETDLLYSSRNVSVARRQQVAAGEQGLSAQAAQASDALSEAAERVASWPLATPGFDLLGPGIQKTYAKSRKAFTKAYREPSDARFHEIHKGVKYHRYQMRVVSNLWPNWQRTYRRSVKSLSDLLDDHHDLAVLRQILLEHPTIFAAANDLNEMLSLIERKRVRPEAEVHVLARRIFAERSA